MIAHGSISFWGWLTFGDKAPQAEQFLRFSAMTTPRTKDTDNDRKQKDDRAPARPTQPPRR